LPARRDDDNVVGMVGDRIKSRRSMARETAPAYGEPAARLELKVTVNGRGRIVLPAEVRERLGIKDGDWLTLTVEPDGVIRMLTGKAWTDLFLETVRRVAPPIAPGRSLADELIAERRREAAKDEREFRRRVARVRDRKRR
jgi:AbrB family looped-hinge helix DNA binding protein